MVCGTQPVYSCIYMCLRLCNTCMCLRVLTCPKPIGCCCWGWNAGVIFCGLLRRGVEWWWCCRPGMPRPLDWHEDSKTRGGRRWRWHVLIQRIWCPHYEYHNENKGRQKAKNKKDATRNWIQLQLQKWQHLWQEALWAYQWFQLCLIRSKPLNIVASVLWIWSRCL